MDTANSTRLHKIIAACWPSFLISIPATGLFFSAFDPEFLFPFGSDTDISRMGIYTIGFFSIWLLTALSSAGTLYFAISNGAFGKQSNSATASETGQDNGSHGKR
jgi:membrane protein YqaA with SNARE-associated domain